MAVWTVAALIGLLGLTDSILEGNSLEVVQAIRGEERSWTRYEFILQETKELLHGYHSWEIRHVWRAANEAAHKIAKMVVFY
jgi:hypothetical protein